MFIGYFGRPPAPGGFQYYSGWMNQSEGNYLILVDDFFNSTESLNRYNQLSTEDKINLVFNSMFGRDALPSGVTYWKQMIETGQISLAAMPYTIAFNAAAADLAVLNAKIAAAEVFMNALKQTPSCSMNIDVGRDFLTDIRSQADADAAIATIGVTITSMCGAGE